MKINPQYPNMLELDIISFPDSFPSQTANLHIYAPLKEIFLLPELSRQIQIWQKSEEPAFKETSCIIKSSSAWLQESRDEYLRMDFTEARIYDNAAYIIVNLRTGEIIESQEILIDKICGLIQTNQDGSLNIKKLEKYLNEK